ncbi:bifunctional UDP-N-acetylglucosamine diphosphorylase/glucosamine-1-phosphate N-acetyltransferase GlmU [Maritimibacter sp. DP1N21-5]|uniref:bifunctional UDP-N-acetylglucosamine diphosphorylase/glucosamine-1-phosphate N-acetyltransferase GlmU n=1 Tax=Maritimibacter sp. DP1N21-5 TaxID=2836867 RepID=UPI001C474D5E|nr:bifunctional UDP-N-acetylglucosamine diphosphorylase/glucosamine-1-phosphate N-acetyltransferase GlmU [Maritimibacter sp. DP1N21-5]MBV7409429.1 bifunctional UDP-N-acetylglucosamine diphosphorylase/glucosamine-1-phosphate N-acetyltransferase GlmU [Maritimibacter sp. DP1N21-5]
MTHAGDASLIILAAGQGSRMNSDLPKVLHELGGQPLFAHALATGNALGPSRVVLVAGHGAEAVTKAAKSLDEEIEVVLQSEQLGTAHAVEQAREALAGVAGDVIVLYGDTPFIRPETLEAMREARSGGADVVILGFEAADPKRYGRLVMEGSDLLRIVEYKDATEDERAITLCNSGVLAADAATLFDLISAVGNENASGEYYLTDVVAVARSRGLRAAAVTCDEGETLGINTRAELAAAEAQLQAMKRAEALENGVTLTAPETVFFAADTFVGRDSVIEPHVVFGPGVTVESGARIRAFSHLEGCHVSQGAVIGPYARLRPGAELAENVKVGNFVEIKNAEIAAGAKVNHLSYIGDATIGEASNIGAGTITCNYDGVFKHRTTIGSHVFVGSNTMLVAPVAIGDGAMTATGTVVTSDVEAGAMVIGRSPQLVKPGFATRFFEKLRALKAEQKGK